MTIEAHVSEVKSWSVHMSFRSLSGGVARHTITLTFKPNGEPLRSAWLHFMEGAEGREASVSASSLSMTLPLSEFRDWLHLLQTEAPLSFSWTLDKAKGKLLGVALFTGSEPPGEGFKDADT